LSFSIPEFPLNCGVYTGPWLAKAYRTDMVCNLAWGKRVSTIATGFAGATDLAQTCMTLLLPAGSDVRDVCCNGVNDIIEVPAGSGRWYQVSVVDDIGKGFPNEHRGAVIVKIAEPLDPTGFAGLFWPTPVP